MEYQSNYGYANVEVDRICEKRAKLGYHALAMQLGVVSQVGYVAETLFKGKAVAADFNRCYAPQTIGSVLETLELLVLSGRPTCSTYIPRLTDVGKAQARSSLVQRVLSIMGVHERIGQLDPSTKLKDLGLDSLSTSMVRQILHKEYNRLRKSGKTGDLSISDLMEIDRENGFNTSDIING